MNIQEIQKLIERRNADAESEMTGEARDLIEQIVACQNAKLELDVKIGECKNKLKSLSVKPLTAAEILGESL